AGEAHRRRARGHHHVSSLAAEREPGDRVEVGPGGPRCGGAGGACHQGRKATAGSAACPDGAGGVWDLSHDALDVPTWVAVSYSGRSWHARADSLPNDTAGLRHPSEVSGRVPEGDPLPRLPRSRTALRQYAAVSAPAFAASRLLDRLARP